MSTVAVRSFIRDLIVGSPLERPARAAVRRAQRLGVARPETRPLSIGDSRHALYDTWTFAIMDRVLTADSNCVDVGAATGGILEEIVKRAPRGRHFAFEPLPPFMRELQSRFPREHYPDVHLFQLAVGNEPGDADFQYVREDPYYSGFRPRWYPFADPKIETITVQVGRLDDLLPSELPISFVKIDVEGGEALVLGGARRILATYRPYVVFEHGLGAADWYGVGPEDVASLLDGCGLRISTLDGWLGREPPLAASEFRRHFADGTYYFLAHP